MYKSPGIKSTVLQIWTENKTELGIRCLMNKQRRKPAKCKERVKFVTCFPRTEILDPLSASKCSYFLRLLHVTSSGIYIGLSQQCFMSYVFSHHDESLPFTLLPDIPGSKCEIC